MTPQINVDRAKKTKAPYPKSMLFGLVQWDEGPNPKKPVQGNNKQSLDDQQMWLHSKICFPKNMREA